MESLRMKIPLILTVGTLALIFVLVGSMLITHRRQAGSSSCVQDDNTPGLTSKKQEETEPKVAELEQVGNSSRPYNVANPATGVTIEEALATGKREQVNKDIDDTRDITELLEELDLELPGISPITGNITDLFPEEEVIAQDMFVSERAKWSRFKRLNGNLALQYVNEQTEEEIQLRCDVEITLCGPEKNRNPHGKILFYQMKLQDKENKWTFTMDGRNPPRFERNDENVSENILSCFMRGGLREIVEMPRRVLSILDLGDGLSGGKVNRKVFFNNYQAFKNRIKKSSDTAESFIFYSAKPYRTEKGEAFAFSEGKFSYWSLGAWDDPHAKVHYGGYGTFDDFDFPAEITAQLGQKKVQLVFSNCKIDTGKAEGL